MRTGYMPQRLPVSCLTMAPRFDTKANVIRGPLTEINNDVRTTDYQTSQQSSVPSTISKKADLVTQQSPDYHLSELHKQLTSKLVSGI